MEEQSEVEIPSGAAHAEIRTSHSHCRNHLYGIEIVSSLRNVGECVVKKSILLAVDSCYMGYCREHHISGGVGCPLPVGGEALCCDVAGGKSHRRAYLVRSDISVPIAVVGAVVTVDGRHVNGSCGAGFRCKGYVGLINIAYGGGGNGHMSASHLHEIVCGAFYLFPSCMDQVVVNHRGILHHRAFQREDELLQPEIVDEHLSLPSEGHDGGLRGGCGSDPLALRPLVVGQGQCRGCDRNIVLFIEEERLQSLFSGVCVDVFGLYSESVVPLTVGKEVYVGSLYIAGTVFSHLIEAQIGASAGLIDLEKCPLASVIIQSVFDELLIFGDVDRIGILLGACGPFREILENHGLRLYIGSDKNLGLIDVTLLAGQGTHRIDASALV